MGDPQQFASGGKLDRDHIQPHIALPASRLDIALSQLAQPALLAGVHSLLGRAGPTPASGLHLDHNQGRSISGDDIDLAIRTTPIPQ